MKGALTAESHIYPNYTNYLYEAPGVSVADRYLLFNPSVHYWIAVEQSGADIVQALPGMDPAGLRSWAQERLRIEEPQFSQEVVPFVSNLLRLGFFSTDKTPPTAGWVPRNFSLHDPEHYPFNDLFISLVDACNLDCAYCFNKTARKRRLRQRPPTRLQPQTIIRAMEEFKALGGSGVCFTGGEPTLDPLLLDYCAAGKRIGLATRFITNGTMLGCLDATKLVDAVDNFAVSLDTLDHAVASQLWGVVRFSVRETILYPLKRICDTAKARGRDTFGVTIKPIVASANLNTLQPMVAEVSTLLAGHSVSWDFSQYEPIGDPNVDQALGVSEDTYNKAMVSCVRTLYPEMQPSTADGEGPSYLEREHAILRLVLGHGGKVQPRREIKIMPCAPSFFVIGSGDVYPCQELEMDAFRLGNISDAPLREMFHHPAFAALRSKMTVDDVEVCNECEFRYVCGRHCHGQAQQQFGRTTAFIHGNRDECRRRMIIQLWLETRGH